MLLELMNLNSCQGHKPTFSFSTHRFYQHPLLLIACNLFRSGTTKHLGEPDFTYQGKSQTAFHHLLPCQPPCPQVGSFRTTWSQKQTLHRCHWWGCRNKQGKPVPRLTQNTHTWKPKGFRCVICMYKRVVPQEYAKGNHGYGSCCSKKDPCKPRENWLHRGNCNTGEEQTKAAKLHQVREVQAGS